MASGALLLIVLLFCCCVSVAAAGVWYYNSTSNVAAVESTSNTYVNSIEGSALTVAPAPEAKAKPANATNCQGSLFADATLGCTDGGNEAGMTWKWATDAQSYACSKAVKKYEVTAYSSKLPSIKLKQIIKEPNQTSAGIKGMPPTWYDGQITFEMMPKDNKGKNLFTRPEKINVTLAHDNASCKSSGVATKDPVPYWNENKNLISVHLHSKYGGNKMGYKIWSNDGSGDSTLYDSGTETIWGAGSPKDTYAVVPKNGGVVMQCDGHLAGWQSWNDDNSWDYMLKGGAAKAGYKWYVASTCASGNAKNGGDNEFRAGW
ncbi:MAG: hypothetical protein EBV73_07095 [Rhodocyclales bacterium]|nr:hypothetical protein [Rhodocyclales bacterium]